MPLQLFLLALPFSVQYFYHSTFLNSFFLSFFPFCFTFRLSIFIFIYFIFVSLFSFPDLSPLHTSFLFHIIFLLFQNPFISSFPFIKHSSFLPCSRFSPFQILFISFSLPFPSFTMALPFLLSYAPLLFLIPSFLLSSLSLFLCFCDLRVFARSNEVTK